MIEDAVRDRLDRGIPQRRIADELGVSKSAVARLNKQRKPKRTPRAAHPVPQAMPRPVVQAARTAVDVLAELAPSDCELLDSWIDATLAEGIEESRAAVVERFGEITETWPRCPTCKSPVNPDAST